MIITGKYPNLRLRRSRKFSWSRRLVQENNLSVNDLILPIFLTEGKNKKIPIRSMPGVFRYSINNLGFIVDKAIKRKKYLANIIIKWTYYLLSVYNNLSLQDIDG